MLCAGKASFPPGTVATNPKPGNAMLPSIHSISKAKLSEMVALDHLNNNQENKHHMISLSSDDEGSNADGNQSSWNWCIFGSSIVLLCLLLFLGQDYIKRTLHWLEHEESWVVCVIFVGLYTMVSLPFAWGYIILNFAGGYLFGLLNGMIVTVTTGALGIYAAHTILQYFFRDFVMRKLITTDSARATLKVLSGPQAFKVVAFTRLTPIPFGLQNAMFSVSSMPTWKYMLATVVGLLPTELINVYLGTTLRSMEDVLQDQSNKPTGYVILTVQVLISILLMSYVVRRAKRELNRVVEEGQKNDVEQGS